MNAPEPYVVRSLIIPYSWVFSLCSEMYLTGAGFSFAYTNSTVTIGGVAQSSHRIMVMTDITSLIFTQTWHYIESEVINHNLLIMFT